MSEQELINSRECPSCKELRDRLSKEQQRAEETEERLLAEIAEGSKLRTAKEKAEAACAAKDKVLRALDFLGGLGFEMHGHIKHALSSDCGKGYFSKEELGPTIELLQREQIAARAMGQEISEIEFGRELSRLQKLTEGK